MGNLRSLSFGVLTIALGLCQSCGEKPSTGYLAEHYEELVNLTVPVDSVNVTRNGVKRTEWTEIGSWEFDAKLAAPQYAEWVTIKLKDDFKMVKSSNDLLAFSREVEGDTEAIVIRLKADHDSLNIRVEASMAPD